MGTSSQRTKAAPDIKIQEQGAEVMVIAVANVKRVVPSTSISTMLTRSARNRRQYISSEIIAV